MIAGNNDQSLQSTLCIYFKLLIPEQSARTKLCDNFQMLMTGTALNARMRRIDLFCKLAGPLFIALIDGASTKIAIFITLGINVLSVPIEYSAIAQVCVIHRIPKKMVRWLTGIGLQSGTPS